MTKPCANKMIEIVLEKAAEKEITDMSADIKEQVVEGICSAPLVSRFSWMNQWMLNLVLS